MSAMHISSFCPLTYSPPSQFMSSSSCLMSCFLCPLLAEFQSLPLVFSLLPRTRWWTAGRQWATGPAMPLFLAFLLSIVGPWGRLAGVGTRWGWGLVQRSCAHTTPICWLEDLLSSILTWLWVLWAWKQFLLSVLTDVYASAGSCPLT